MDLAPDANYKLPDKTNSADGGIEDKQQNAVHQVSKSCTGSDEAYPENK